MRYSRLKKFKTKNKTFLLTLKIALAWYLILLSASYLTGGTSAHFTDTINTENLLSVGTWEIEETDEPEEAIDESRLKFTDKKTQRIEACGDKLLKVNLKNSGKSDMEHDGRYEVYYGKKGNPKNQGEKLKLAENEGKIKALKKGESVQLTYKTDKPGVYVFVAYQTNEHLKKDTVESGKIIVSCETEEDKKTKPVEKEDEPSVNTKETEHPKEQVKGEKSEEKKPEKAQLEKSEPTKEEKTEKPPETVKEDKVKEDKKQSESKDQVKQEEEKVTKQEETQTNQEDEK
ncbi:amyloid fiber anchoring/assembly protein TapA [Virgibacillus halodenitrificans]|uniref:amyloid fiber anchoring/assembly protein TapA n=1 Tax=Virgibacillus halodenitrificans TaxID=1482 RepID=UPI002DB921A3|nr:amyloid fiber anchoring/assembly protein TapA [Virgibacillus halodenitrificans]MEC2160552.1 amyloid fiber anchoring/assembly protein TapA [Virgibacillus halodenitrificans]